MAESLSFVMLGQLEAASDAPVPLAPSTGVPSPTQAPLAPQGSSDGGMTLFIILLGTMLLVMYLLTGRARAKEESDRKKFLDTLKKADRVVTSSGIIGTVTDVKAEEITLKVDENTNTRMTFLKTAVLRVLDDPAKKA